MLLIFVVAADGKPEEREWYATANVTNKLCIMKATTW